MQNKIFLLVLALSLVLFGCIDNAQVNVSINATNQIQNNTDSNSTSGNTDSSDLKNTNISKGEDPNLRTLEEIGGSEEFFYIENGTPTNYLENASEINSTAIKGGVKVELNTSRGVRTILWQGQTEIRSLRELEISKRTPGCPHEIIGNPSAKLNIKYFWAITCPWCARFDPFIPTFVQEMGDVFVMEKYDVFKCTAEIVNYGVISTPTFIFSTNSSEGVYVVGFRGIKEFGDLISYYSS